MVIAQLALGTTCKKLTRELKLATEEYDDYESYETDHMMLTQERMFKSKQNMDFDKKSQHIYLKDLLETINQTNANDDSLKIDDGFAEKDVCNLKMVEISVKVTKCGRVRLNTTVCEGVCKSHSKFIISSNYQKTNCYACKAYQFEYIKHRVKCDDGISSAVMLKRVKSCSCFKNSEQISQVNLIHRKKSTNYVHP